MFIQLVISVIIAIVVVIGPFLASKRLFFSTSGMFPFLLLQISLPLNFLSSPVAVVSSQTVDF